MFDNDNQERNSNPNRFFFFNNPRKSTPILSREGYATFTTTFTLGWIVCVTFIFWIHLQFTATKDVISAMSSSAVDLAALSLAVLGILHEFNKEDRWFKLGLFLIGFIFALDCLLGFYLVVSWKEVYSLPQDFSVTVFGVFLIGFLLQTDWEFFYNRFSIKLPKIFQRSILILSKITLLNRVRISIPFVIPFFLIWINKLTPVLAFLLIFLGGIIALLCLMLATSLSVVYQHKNMKEQDAEDPSITYARQSAVQQIENNKKLQELKETILESLKEIQQDQIDQINDSDNTISMIGEDIVVSSLRRKGINTNRQDIYNALEILVKRNQVFKENHEYWIAPSKDQINSLSENIKRISWFGTRLSKSQSKSQLEWKNFETFNLLTEMAKLCFLPLSVVKEFILPKSSAILYDTQIFQRFEFPRTASLDMLDIIFVNSKIKQEIESYDWDDIFSKACSRCFREWILQQPQKLQDNLSAWKSYSRLGDTKSDKQRREIKIQELAQELVIANELAKSIPLNNEDAFYKFVHENTEIYLQVVKTDEFLDRYYFELSTRALPITLKILRNGIVINDSDLFLRYPEEYSSIDKRLEFRYFFETLELKYNPSFFLLSKKILP